MDNVITFQIPVEYLQKLLSSKHNGVVSLQLVNTQSSKMDLPVNRGGGNKRASQKQLDFLNSMCRSRHLDMTTECHSRFGKSPEDLLGSEANDFIQALKH